MTGSQQSDATPTGPRVARAASLAGATAIAVLVMSLPAGAATQGPVTFQLPSRNIACLYAPREHGIAAYLRCDVLSGLRPEPTVLCELDWTGVSLRASGRARPNCAGDTVYDPRERVLAYGQIWRRGGLTCWSRAIGLRCTNPQRHGFTLARERYTVF